MSPIGECWARGRCPPAPPLLAGRWPAERLERFALQSLDFSMIIIIINNNSNNVGRGGAAPPAPPLLAGRWPAGNLERFAIRSLDFNSVDYYH